MCKVWIWGCIPAHSHFQKLCKLVHSQHKTQYCSLIFRAKGLAREDWFSISPGKGMNSIRGREIPSAYTQTQTVGLILQDAECPQLSLKSIRDEVSSHLIRLSPLPTPRTCGPSLAPFAPALTPQWYAAARLSSKHSFWPLALRKGKRQFNSLSCLRRGEGELKASFSIFSKWSVL